MAKNSIKNILKMVYEEGKKDEFFSFNNPLILILIAILIAILLAIYI